jgi:ribonuclease Z
MKQNPSKVPGLRVVVCGSASPLGNDPKRAQACIAVLTPEHFFIFDAGAGSQNRIGQAQLPMDRLSGVFLTHFHSDHIAALPDINLNAWVMGAKASLRVYGPVGVSNGRNDNALAVVAVEKSVGSFEVVTVMTNFEVHE